MKDKILENYVKNLSKVLYVLGGLDIIGFILVFSLPLDFIQTYASTAFEKVAFAFGMLLSAAVFFLCAWGIKKHDKIAYVFTWLLVLLTIFKLKLIGLVLAIFMVFWLIKSKKLFFK